jgi:predicted glycosyltransferase
MVVKAKLVWIDLDNSPHVPFFRPIIDELQANGCALLLTARDAFQVAELTKLHHLKSIAIGRHFGKNPFMKVLGLLVRSAQLLPLVVRERPDLAVSHGSRAQTMVAKLLGIPSVVIADYEHVRHVTHPDWVIVPEVIPTDVARKLAKRVVKYPGIKEDVYVASFQPDPSVLAELRLTPSEIIVTVRPPATEAHYHNPESEKLFTAVIDWLCETEGVRTILLPRNDRQNAEICRRWPEMLQAGKLVIPGHAVEGLNLIWHSDLVISGGGTMNREAAALGVPVYSIFRGKIGAVDRFLAENGRLVLVGTVGEVRENILLIKRRLSRSTFGDRSALQAIVNGILAALDSVAA